MSYDVNSHHLSNLRAVFTIISRAPSHPITNSTERLWWLTNDCAKSTSNEVLGTRVIVTWQNMFGLLLDLLDCNSLIIWHLDVLVWEKKMLPVSFVVVFKVHYVQSNSFICQLVVILGR